MRILCLHGFGTNPEIMKHQMSPLLKHCDPNWEFHFLAGTVECPPAPDIATRFPGPYLCWDLDLYPKPNKAALRRIHETLTKEGPFTFNGVFGFSQGASMVAACLLDQKTQFPENPLPVQFGIFCSPVPFLATDRAYIDSVYGTLTPENLARLRSAKRDEISLLPESVRADALMLLGSLAATTRIHGRPPSHFFDRAAGETPCVLNPDLCMARLDIPTLHVCSANDPASLRRSSVLAEGFCEGGLRRSFRHRDVHNLPRDAGEAREMVGVMVEMVEGVVKGGASRL
ncbi:serine hydrolase FSH [Aspergillus californicus]